jgi:hypothetical protein
LVVRSLATMVGALLLFAATPVVAQRGTAPDELEDIGDPGEPDPAPAAPASPASEDEGSADDEAASPAEETTGREAAPAAEAAPTEADAPADGQAPVGAEAAGDGAQTQPEDRSGKTEADKADEGNEGDDEAAPPLLSPLAQEQIKVLHVIEGRLSVGDELGEAQLKELVRLAAEGDDPRVRALATAILPWLGPVVMADIIAAARDPEPMVRAQAMNSLVSLARAMNSTQRSEVLGLADKGLSDASDEVACAASRLLVSLDSEAAVDRLEQLADDAGDVRFGCFRQYAGLPMREIVVAEPVLPDPVLTTPSNRPVVVEPSDQVNLMGGIGRGILITTFAGAGVVAGGLLNGSFFPPRDTLTYTRRTTTLTREEPNVLYGAAGAAIGGAALGAAAFGLQYGLGWADFAPATTVLGMTIAGAAGGYGLGLAFNLDEPWQGLSMIGGTLAGLAIGSPFVWVLKPDEKDLTVMASAAGAMTLSGAMLTFAIVPEGFPVLFDRVRRADFGTGVGLMAGSVGAVGALLASPLLDISHGRMLAASGAGLFAGATGLAAGYLIPIAFDALGLPITRSRIASGLGLIFGWAAATTAFVLLPDSWARMFERVRASKATSAVAIEGGKLKLGTPVVWTRDVSSLNEQRMAVGMDLLSGDF